MKDMTINLLIAEDQPRHQDDCRKTLEQFHNVRATMVSDFMSGYHTLAKPGDCSVDVVVTGVHMPHSPGLQREPYGIFILAQGLKREVPYIVNTSLYRHSENWQRGFQNMYGDFLRSHKSESAYFPVGCGAIFEVWPNTVALPQPRDELDHLLSGIGELARVIGGVNSPEPKPDFPAKSTQQQIDEYTEQNGSKPWRAVLGYAVLLAVSRKKSDDVIANALFSKILKETENCAYHLEKIMDHRDDWGFPMSEWLSHEDTRRAVEFVRHTIPIYAPEVFK